MSGGERRVVVISRNPSMTWGLTLPGCTVDSVRPAHLEEWAVNARDEVVDLVVLDLGVPGHAADGVRLLRSHARLAPVLIVGDDDPGWSAPDVVDLPGTHLVPLPADRPRLLAAMGRLLDRDPSPFPPVVDPVAAPPARERSGTDTVGGSDAPSATVLSPTVPPPAVEAPAAPAPAPQRVAPPVPPSPPDTVVAPADPAPVASADRLAAVPHVTMAPRPRAASGSLAATDDPAVVVRHLLRSVDAVYGVGETAWAVLSDVLDRTEGSAGCVLLQDDRDGRWHVVASHGLAAVERRMTLEPGDWWIDEVVLRRQALIASNERGDPHNLPAAPLTRRPHLLASAVPEADALLLLARDGDDPFEEHHLSSVAGLHDEAGRLLLDALDARTLARRLAVLLEYPEASAP